MIYKIYQVDGDKRKYAQPVRDREELMALRNSPKNLQNLIKARQGDGKAKADLLQLAYNIGHVNGLIAGCKSIGSYFFHDVDCYGSIDNGQLTIDNCTSESERIKNLILEKKEEIGLRMLERSASGGWHLVCERRPGTTILENQVRVATILKLEMDTSPKDLQRVVFSTSGSEEDLPYLDDCLFTEPMSPEECEAEYERLRERQRRGEEVVPAGAKKANKHYRPWEEANTNFTNLTNNKVLANTDNTNGTDNPSTGKDSCNSSDSCSKEKNSLAYNGLPYADIVRKWWQLYNDGKEPVRSNRDVLTFELAINLRHICGFDRQLMDQVIPCYDGFPQDQKMKCIDSALAERRTQMPKRLRDVLIALRQDTLAHDPDSSLVAALDEIQLADELYHYDRLPPLPQGVKDSVDATGHSLAMPTLIAIAPAIGALATGVKLDVHGCARGLNLCSFVVGEFGSGKGQMDDVIDAWKAELQAEADIYTQQEEEWAAKTKRMKSGKAPEEPKLPVRCLTLNNTVANIAERLANTQGKHSFSFTPEADTVAQKWKQTVSDFSVMLRQAYDEARYDREAKSADAVRVHIPKLLWNVVMCGTQDALYRVVTNYTDGLLSRLSIARTPDNTFSPLAEHPSHITDLQAENIRQVAHLLPLLTGTVVLPKLEQRGREWLENIRLEAMKNDDRVLARQRIRGCVNAQRITTALWLPKVAEMLIRKHGLNGAETQLKLHPDLWIGMLVKLQTPEMMRLFDLVADYLIDNDLYFFRDRIEQAYESRNYQGNAGALRRRCCKNDSIFGRLSDRFTFEQAMQQAIALKGTSASNNSTRQMLKNWRNQGLITRTDDGCYQKIGNVK